MDAADLIWNRAALNDGGSSPGVGDPTLAAALAFHGLAMSGGVLDDDDLADGLERDADERYGVLLPSDAVLNAAFRARLKEAPDAFA